MTPNKLLSLVFLSYYSKERIEPVYLKIKKELEKENIPFELIIIDDGSEDDSHEVACELEKQDNRVRAYQLSKNYTSDYALFAGFSICKGACASGVSDDLQTPLETIIKMYRLWERGSKVVVSFRASRNDGRVNDFFSNFYYRVMNSISEVTFPRGGVGFSLIDREIIDILNHRIHPRNTSVNVEILRLGFDPIYIPFDRPPTVGKSRWTFKKKVRLALNTIISSSSFPIKFITTIGFSAVLFAILLILVSAILKLTNQNNLFGIAIPGWTSTFILISFFSGTILFSLGVIAEYIWRILEEVKDRPGYIIKKKDEKTD